MNRKRLQSRPDRVFTEGNEIEELAKAAENEEFEEIESEDEDDKTSEDGEGEKNGEEEFEVLEKKKVRFSERKTGKPKSKRRAYASRDNLLQIIYLTKNHTPSVF